MPTSTAAMHKTYSQSMDESERSENNNNLNVPIERESASIKSSSPIPPVAPHHLLPPQEEENILRRSLKEITDDIKKMEDFITLTEDIIRRERERDREFYLRERRRKISENQINNARKHLFQVPTNKQLAVPPSTNDTQMVRHKKENKTPTSFRKKFSYRLSSNKIGCKANLTKKSTTTYKINGTKSNRRLLKLSPRKCKSRLYFRNGKIGCINADENMTDSRTNIEKTHAIIKYITDDIDIDNDLMLKRSSLTSNISDILSDESSASMEDIRTTNNYFNFDCSPVESENRDPIDFDDDSFVNSLSDMDLKPFSENKDEMFEADVFENDEITIRDEESVQDESCADHHINVMHYEVETIVQKPNDETINESKIPKPPDSAMSNYSNTTLNSEIKNQVRHLVRRFTMRTGKMRSRLEMPPTPSSTNSSPSQQHQTMVSTMKKLNSNSKSDSTTTSSSTYRTNAHPLFEADEQHPNLKNPFFCPMLCGGKGSGGNKQGVLDPQGSFYISWLCIVSLTFLYNAWVIPLRSTFPFQTVENTNTWLIIDFCADVIYLLDVIFIKHRIMYLYEGFWVRDKDLTRKNYMRKLKFKLDILSLIPLDLFYLKLGTNAVYLRAPRLLKIQSFWEVYRLLDRVIASPYLVRVGRTLTYMLYMIHITACTYYAYSDYQGLGTDRWVFSGRGHPYVRCFAFATKTATSIGKNPKPDSEGELMFMTAAWLMGVFVFALLIGQIRDIIATATRSQTEYRQLVDETLECMRTLNLPADSLDRVKKWFKFTWEQQRTIDENLILDYLPSNLKTDIAIAVHIQTLSKVQLFADCEEALLRELVLKLRSVTFLPDDYVCRKGEIGKEMYIVKWGQVQVMGGRFNDEVLATLTESSVFGEISLLAINGIEGKRRTADVRSKGFSNLFVLSKSDLNDAIAQYPQAQAILKRRAQSVMRKNAAREREQANTISSMCSVDVVIANPSTPPSPPKLLETVIKALPEESAAVQLLTRGSRRVKKRRETIDESGRKLTINFDDMRVLSIEPDKLNAPPSPDLLSAIQMTLATQNKHMNLTDTEKALIVSGGSEPSSQADNKIDFLDPIDGRMECYELENLSKLNGVIDHTKDA